MTIHGRIFCAVCGLEKPLLGSKIKFYRGLRRRACGGCAENLSKPPKKENPPDATPSV